MVMLNAGLQQELSVLQGPKFSESLVNSTVAGDTVTPAGHFTTLIRRQPPCACAGGAISPGWHPPEIWTLIAGDASTPLLRPSVRELNHFIRWYGADLHRAGKCITNTSCTALR
jgi:hypothetical protein